MEYNQQDLGLGVYLIDIKKIYTDQVVLNDINLTIYPHDFISIVGKSGCGKSTLLRLLASLDQPTSGTIHFKNNNIIDKQNSDVRLMFQDSRLLPWKNVIENVRLGLKSKDSVAKAEKVLNDVGLLEKAYVYPNELSGGQKQRVALARALIHQPKLLLLDEPLGALDALTRLDMQHLIEKLWLEYQFTTILVTHDINEAVITANRVIVLEHGNIGLDLPIPMARPRKDLAEIAHYEQIILDKIMQNPLPTQDFII
ncbi:ATP-binding cassette domain-containing protein [Neisseriaceae bacterium PsAf]|nr:ATP-binding cassette domain-containing protein [Neisseriaceae bacterium PsAf]